MMMNREMNIYSDAIIIINELLFLAKCVIRVVLLFVLFRLYARTKCKMARSILVAHKNKLEKFWH